MRSPVAMASGNIEPKRNNALKPSTAPQGIDAQWNALSLPEFRHRLLPGLPLDDGEQSTEIDKKYTFAIPFSTGSNEPQPMRSTTGPTPNIERPSASQPQVPCGYVLTFSSSTTISKADLETCFDLIESTSSAAYKASSTGWHPRRKKAEMKLLDMKYLLLRPLNCASSSSPGVGAPAQAFVSFMLTMEDGYFVVYIYEIHLSQQLQGNGIGAWMMEIVEGAGTKARCQKAMLTVWRSNEGARRLYERLGWAEDEFSPAPRRMRGGRVMECEYVIMSKRLEHVTG